MWQPLVRIKRLQARELVRHTELVRGSVSIRKTLADKAGLCHLDMIRDDRLYIWPDGHYDHKLLGIMKYMLALKDISDENLAFV